MSLTTSHAPTFKLTTWKATFELKIGMFVVFMVLFRFRNLDEVMLVTRIKSKVDGPGGLKGTVQTSERERSSINLDGLNLDGLNRLLSTVQSN